MEAGAVISNPLSVTPEAVMTTAVPPATEITLSAPRLPQPILALAPFKVSALLIVRFSL